jgi:hypothetical protein
MALARDVSSRFLLLSLNPGVSLKWARRKAAWAGYRLAGSLLLPRFLLLSGRLAATHMGWHDQLKGDEDPGAIRSPATWRPLENQNHLE